MSLEIEVFVEAVPVKHFVQGTGRYLKVFFRESESVHACYLCTIYHQIN